MAWLSDYAKRIELIVDSGVIDSNLTHFPVPIFLNSSAGKNSSDITEIFDDLGSNSKKIAVTKDDGTTQLYVEIEQWDSVNEKAVLWVSKSDLVLSSTSDTILYLYFDNTKADNTTYVADNGSRSEVWNSNFKFVHHLTSSLTDSSGNGHNLILVNTPDVVNSKIGNGRWFNGTNEGSYVADNAELESNQFTASVWAQQDALTQYRHVLNKWSASDFSWMIRAQDDPNSDEIVVYVRSASGTTYNFYTTILNRLEDVYYHIVLVYNGSGATNADKGKIIVNGIEQTCTYSGTLPSTLKDSTNNISIGYGYASGSQRYWNGYLDEARWSNTNRSVDWVKTEYYAEDDNILTFGSIESQISVSESDSLTLSDKISFLISKIDDDSITIFDSVDVSFAKSISELDSLTVSDTLTNIEILFNIERNEPITISDTIIVNVPQENIVQSDTLTISDSIDIFIPQTAPYATRIISYNPLAFVTDTNPAKLAIIDITNPVTPTWQTYILSGYSDIQDIILNTSNDYIYVFCADGQVIKLEKANPNNKIVIDTLDTNNLLHGDSIDEFAKTFASTNDTNGELIVIDESNITLLNTDLRWLQSIEKIIETRLNTINGQLINTDLRLIAETTVKLRTDLRWLAYDYPDISLYPIDYSDWQVLINSVDMCPINDVQMDSIQIVHTIGEKSQVSFILNRRHDKLNYTNTDIASQITNNNSVQVYISGHLEFDGKIASISTNSESESVSILAKGNQATDKRHLVTLPMPSVNEKLHLYHCLVNDVSLDNPYIDPNEENPEYYKGIQVDLGTEIIENINRRASFYNGTWLAQDVSEGNFQTKQNWTYFWFVSAKNIRNGLTQATERYVGTSPASLSSDLWQLLTMSFKYQREYEETETALGIYQIGSAPYQEISVKNGKLIPKDAWEDKADGLYRVRREGYDYTDYAKKVADLEYEKLTNINDDVLPIIVANIETSIDGYYYYNIALLTRINISNTTTPNIYNNNTGFPVAVQTITINSATMKVTLNTSNKKSIIELEEIDATYPDEESDEYIFEAQSKLNYSKFDYANYKYTV